MNVQALPKIELHLHLDCSLSYQAVLRLAPGTTLQEYRRDFVAPSRCQNLTEFLSRAPQGFRLMQTEEALRLVTRDVFQQLADDGVIYAELRFAPLLHTERGLSPQVVVEIVDDEVDVLVRETGIQAGVILCTLRHFSAAQSMTTAGLVREFRGSRVVALDIAGDEAGFPLDAHVAAFEYARQHGLHCTAHAGEACGAKSVWETLERLKPTRIGHGIRSIEDPSLVQHLRQERIHLEVCPCSNVQIVPSVRNLEAHPVDRLYRSGVALNLNTDCRMLTPTTLTEEYEGLSRVFHWGAEELLETNLMAAQAAFTSDDLKQILRQRLVQGYYEGKPPNLQHAGGDLRLLSQTENR